MTTVIFACVHNAGRSQMAAAFFNLLADPTRARALSAGTDPGPHVHPEVVAAMREKGIDVAAARPQRLTPELAAGAQLLVTMGCGEACPVAPGVRRDDWPLPDPNGQPVERVRAIRDEVEERVRRLLAAHGWLRASSPNEVALRPASPGDLDALEALLRAAGLPPDGLRDQFPAAYTVAEVDGVLVGAAGLERYGDAGLLRSVVVRDGWRGRGLGEALVRARLEAAEGLTRVYALTTTAAAYFPRLGFAPADRADAPAGIRGAPQVATICPSTAAFLALDLER